MKTLLLALVILAAAVRPALAQDAPRTPGAPPVSQAEAGDDDVNARYVVDGIEIRGINLKVISQQLQDDLQRVVGGPLSIDQNVEFIKRLETEQPDYEVVRRLSRGNEQGHIRVTYHMHRTERSRWIPWTDVGSKLVWHEDQGWSGVFDLRFSEGPEQNQAFSLGIVRGNADDRVEEYTGYWLRAMSREVGTRRLGLSFEFGRYRQKWHDETVGAMALNPTVPGLYGHRQVVEPIVTFAITHDLRVSGGASISELDPVDASQPSQRANAAIAGIELARRWKANTAHHTVQASYTLRSSSAALNADLIYSRHAMRAAYAVVDGRNAFAASATFGRITGTAPLFERFTLGDTLTLRGWDKYAIAPIGGTGVAHTTIEYRYRALTYYVDAGSVWTRADEREIRLAAGVGLSSREGFLMVGFPLNGDRVNPTIMLGHRWGLTWGF